MSTNTTDALYELLIARLVGFTSGSGATLASLAGWGAAERIYIDRPPDAVNYPYQVVRLLPRFTDGTYHGMRVTFGFEVLTVGRPQAGAATAERMADVTGEAFAGFANATSGLVVITRSQRDTLPALTSPIATEVHQVRQQFDGYAWPTMLTQYGGIS